MKILMANNFFYNRDGECAYFFSLKKLLEERGHKVIPFSMHHPENFHSEYSQYFVRYINYAEEVKNQTIGSSLKVIMRSIYSLEAKRNIELLLQKEKPDIAHIQGIYHHITPSIFYPLKKGNIPIIWTLHNYGLICPNAIFFNQSGICEQCKRSNYYWAPILRCKKKSLGASLVAAIETSIHRMMGILNQVDTFIAPSNFLKNKLTEYGLDKHNIVCLNNFMSEVNAENNNSVGKYYLYVGRLTEEKGIKTLIDAAIKADTGQLLLVGDGPLKESLVNYVKEKNAGRIIEFLGHKSRTEVIDLIKKCNFVVVPSEWYENFPYSILEAFACGKPVIGSRIGGITELVKDNETGLTFTPGISDELRMKIVQLINEPTKILKMGRNAMIFVRDKLNSETHYEKLMMIYEEAITKKKNTI